MYRFDYSLDDYLRVTDNCANHVKMLLQTRYDELEHIREAINDRVCEEKSVNTDLL